MSNLEMLKIERRIADAVNKARCDLHVDKLHQKYMEVLDSMSMYLNTVENIQKWQQMEQDAKAAYDAAAFEAYCVGKRLEKQLISETP